MNKLKEIKENISKNKLLSVIFTIIKVGVYIALTLLLLIIVVQKFSNNNTSIGGFRVFTVASESMKGEYEIGDIIITKYVEEDMLSVGDNVTYLGNAGAMNGKVITHKIVNIREDDAGNKVFTTKGIANTIADPEITYSQIYGKVVCKTAILSYVGRYMTNPVVYYILFFAVGIIFSIEISSSIFESKKEDDADE